MLSSCWVSCSTECSDNEQITYQHQLSRLDLLEKPPSPNSQSASAVPSVHSYLRSYPFHLFFFFALPPYSLQRFFVRTLWHYGLDQTDGQSCGSIGKINNSQTAWDNLCRATDIRRLISSSRAQSWLSCNVFFPINPFFNILFSQKLITQTLQHTPQHSLSPVSFKSVVIKSSNCQVCRGEKTVWTWFC